MCPNISKSVGFCVCPDPNTKTKKVGNYFGVLLEAYYVPSQKLVRSIGCFLFLNLLVFVSFFFFKSVGWFWCFFIPTPKKQWQRKHSQSQDFRSLTSEAPEAETLGEVEHLQSERALSLGRLGLQSFFFFFFLNFFCFAYFFVFFCFAYFFVSFGFWSYLCGAFGWFWWFLGFLSGFLDPLFVFLVVLRV